MIDVMLSVNKLTLIHQSDKIMVIKYKNKTSKDDFKHLLKFFLSLKQFPNMRLNLLLLNAIHN